MKRALLTFALILLAVGLGALVAFERYELSVPGTDDADIFFVYARDAADGHGFVYNVGNELFSGRGFVELRPGLA